MASTPSPLNKKLWTQLTKIKLLDEDDNLKRGRFIYESSSFDYSQGELPADYAQNVIVGRLQLTSDIYKNHDLRIEIHLPPQYPMKGPEIILKTPIYHPNVNEKDRLCDDRLNHASAWDNQTTLIGLLDIIVDALDHPHPEGTPANPAVANEYTKNRAEYERKAKAMIEKNGLRRS